MKKNRKILLAAVLFSALFSSIFAENKLYIALDSKLLSWYEREEYDDYGEEELYIIHNTIISEVQALAERRGISVYDIETLSLKGNAGWGPSTLERLRTKRDQIIEDMEDENSIYNRYSSFFIFDEKPLAQQLEEIEMQIKEEEAKEAAKIDPSECFPYLKLEVEINESYGKFENLLEITSYYYPTKSSDSIIDNVALNADAFSTVQSRISFTENIICAFLPVLENKVQSESPVFIDSKAYERKIDNSNISFDLTRNVELAALDDYSFIFRNGNHVAEYSYLWEENKSYDNELSKYKTSGTWQLFSTEDSNIIFANTSTPNVLILDSNKILKKKSSAKYNQGGYYYLRFDMDGKAYQSSLTDSSVYLIPDNGSNSVPCNLQEIFAGANVILAGPDKTFYVSNSRFVFVITRNYTIKKVFLLHSDDQTYGTISKVFADGSFLVTRNNGKNSVVSRYNSDGSRKWVFYLPSDYKYATVLDSANGMTYVLNEQSPVIGRFAEVDAKLPKILTKLQNGSSKKTNSLIEQAEMYLDLANTYYEASSYTAALEQYEKYLEISPNDFEAAEKKQICENAINKTEAEKYYNKALDLYDEYGEETAKEDYQNAIKLLEKLKKNIPWDTDVIQMFTELKQTFSPSDSINAEISSVSVEQVKLTSLFPVLMNLYANHESGFIQIKNNSNSAIKNVSVTSYARRYMDFACEGQTVTEIAPDETCLLEIKTPLNKNVLSLSEAVTVQMQFTIKWEENNKRHSTTITRPVVIYNSSAISWSDTAMLSCFVQPNNEAVKNFVFNVLQNKGETVISKNITTAMKVSNAIASIPLTYISDPSYPSSQLIDNKFAVDTVRFSDETLQLKGGDCDDMTTLFCSALEATGVPTAFVTIPGHIFAAFNTGLTNCSIWENLGDNLITFEIDNKVWIPVEVTSLNNGFFDSWKVASKEISAEDEENLEIVTLNDAWQVYSSIASETVNQNVTYNVTDFTNFNTSSISSINKSINEALAAVDYSNASAAELNTYAKLFHQQGDSLKALELLSMAISKDSNFRMAYSNISKIYKILGDIESSDFYRIQADNLYLVEGISISEEARASDADDIELED